MYRWKIRLLTLFALSSFAWAGMAATESVGQVSNARGEVELTREGQAVGVKKKDEIYAGDVIETGPRGLLVAQLVDKTRLVLGNNAKTVVHALKYQEGAEDNAVDLEVAKGAFRFVSGLTAKGNPDATKLRLGKLATIGVRGTHFGGEVTETGARVMLLNPADGSDRPTAIVVTNEFGSVTIDQPGYGTYVEPGKAPTAPESMQLPILACPLFLIQ